MSNKKKSYYLVVHGRKPGLYTQWHGPGGAAEQVADFPEAIYKGFYTLEGALNWLKSFSKENLEALAPDLADLLNHASQGNTPTEAIVNEDAPSEKVMLYTDGGALSNPGPGGYGVVLRDKGHRKELSGGFRHTTSNRMELMACIQGLRFLKRKANVVIYSDSKYVVDVMNQGRARRWRARGWRRKNRTKAENSDLWAQLLELCELHEVEFRWVKGQNSLEENERCDRLAMQAAQRSDLPADEGYENTPRDPPTPSLFEEN